MDGNGDKQAMMDGLGDVVARARARRDQLATGRRRIFPLPGYGGELGGEFVPPTAAVMDELRRKGMASLGDGQSAPTRAQIDAACEFLYATCMGIFVPDGEGGWSPLDPDPSHPPVRFDERLTGALGLTVQSGGRAVADVLAVDVNPLRLSAFVQDVFAWMSGEDAEGGVTGELVGESKPTRS